MGFQKKTSKHLTVFSSERVNIKKLANLTANTKNYRQITLNTKPHSDPLFRHPEYKLCSSFLLKDNFARREYAEKENLGYILAFFRDKL